MAAVCNRHAQPNDSSSLSHAATSRAARLRPPTSGIWSLASFPGLSFNRGMSSSPPAPHPDWSRLIEKREALRSQIAAVLTDTHALADSRPVAIARYAAAFGDRLIRLQRLEIEAARLKREIGLVQAEINSGRDIDYGIIHETLEKEFAEWQAKLDAEATGLLKLRGVLDDLLDPATFHALRDLYRTLARRLHPDLNPSQSTAAAELWHRVSTAYGERNLSELQALEILSSDAPSAPPPGSLEALRSLLEQLRGQLEQLLTTLAARRKEWPFDQSPVLDDPAATAARQAELDQRIAAAAALRDERKQWLNQLLDH